MIRAPRSLRRFVRDDEGAAAAEVVLWVALLVIPILSVIELGVYVTRGIQVATAADQAAHAVHRACGFNAVPVTDASRCDAGTVTGALTTGLQSTSLGSSITLGSGYPAEQYFCVDDANTLVAIGSAGTLGSPPVGPSPLTCDSVVSGSAAAPSSYLQVQASYAYTPIFSSVSIAALLPTPITRTAWLRLG